MNSEIVSIHCTSEKQEADTSNFATAGDLTLHGTLILNQTQVLITINPSITGYSAPLTELTQTEETAFKIFDIHEHQTHRFSLNGRKYEIEFLTWARPKQFTLKFDFDVRYE